MSGKEFEEVQKKPEAQEGSGDRDPFADVRMQRPDSQVAGGQAERAKSVEELDLAADDPLAKQGLEQAGKDLDRYSDMRSMTRGSDPEALDRNAAEFAKKSPAEREAEIKRWQDYIGSLGNYLSTHEKTYK